MKRLLTLVAFFATLQASAQQVNPVPDYVFANRMSAGRNTVTDTAAYFSIGPRYGATRGMMPPMVVDTASFSANKRNGLLIFSVQKNKFLYWDSVGVKWAEMAGTGGTAISSGDTAAMLLPYVRHAGYGLTKSGQAFFVDTLNISTRAWRQKGIDSVAALSRIAGSGTTNYVPKFTASTTLGNSQIFDNGTTVGIGTTTLNAVYKLQVQGQTRMAVDSGQSIIVGIDNVYGQVFTASVDNNGDSRLSSSKALIFRTQDVTERMRIHQNGRIGINTTVDAGYRLDISGALRTTDGASFGTTSGDVTIATTTSSYSSSGRGNLTIGGSSTSLLAFQTASTARAYILHNGTNMDINNTSNGYILFATDASDRGRITNLGEWLINTSTDAGDYKLQVVGNIYNTGSITTGAPSGGSIKPWKIGEAATVSPTSPNRTLRVEVDGVVYYIHAKTTND